MFMVPQKIKGVYHPLIQNMFIKSEPARGQQERVLVIEAGRVSPKNTLVKSQARSQQVINTLLEDLDILTEAVEHNGLQFDRVDIRVH